MRLAIISDVHANADALAAILRAISINEAEALVVAGDIVGYYFEPKRTLELLRGYEKPIYMVRGNHEEMLLRAFNSDAELAMITEKYGPGIQLALNQLSISEIKWITSLPHPLEINNLGCSILLCHGSPANPSQYIYPDTPLDCLLQRMNYIPDVLITGHTHYPMVKKFGTCLVVNPGSVGQPRNRVPGAHWAMLDTQTISAEQFVEPYDFSSIQASCMHLAPQLPYLSEVLERS
jgi:putative phosphoesterase